MESAWRSVVVLLGMWAVAQTLVITPAEAQLSPFFYTESCPQVFPIVAKTVFSAILEDTRVAATLLRLHFHDCFVHGCDASILLDDTSSHQSEKEAPPNKNSITEAAYDTIDSIKEALECSCPNVVSCADIVTLAAFYSVVLSGGPVWVVPLGRRDSLISYFANTTELVGPDFNIALVKSQFQHQNLTTVDIVALSGAHTIGLARCASVVTRLYNFTGNEATNPNDSDPTINPKFLAYLKKRCPKNANGNQLNVTNNMDLQTPTVFDNLYYKNILAGEGLFTTDQELYTAANDTNQLVQLYAQDQDRFFSDFGKSMTRMGNLSVLTGKAGQVRQNCRVANSGTSIISDDQGSALNTAVEKIEGDMEKFEDFMRNVVKDIILGVELDKLVEDSIIAHASI